MAFAVPAGVLIYYALRGGSYDIVVRQEEALAVWWVLALGFALGLLPRVQLARSQLIGLAFVFALTAWTGLSLIWTPSSERTLAEVARVVHYAGLLLLLWSLVDSRTWRNAAAGFAFGAFVVCALAVASRLSPGAFPTNYIGRDFHIDRLSYPFNYWNAVGAWGVMSIAMGLSWSAHAPRLPIRAVSLAAVPVCVTSVYVSYSRAGAIGSVLAVLVVLMLSRNRWVAAVHALAAAGGSALIVTVIRHHHQIADATGNSGAPSVILAIGAAVVICIAAAAITWSARGDARWRLPVPAGRVAVAVVAVGIAIAGPTVASAKISHAWADFKKPASPAATADPAKRLTSLSGGRYDHWAAAVHAFQNKPLTGQGAGTFQFWWQRHRGQGYVRNAHSLYFETLGELGLPGLLLMVGLLGTVAIAALLGRRRFADPADLAPYVATTSAFLVFLFHAGVDWMWQVTAVSVLGLGAGGLALCASTRPRAAPVRPPLRVALVGGALVAAAIQLPALASTSAIRESQHSAARGEIPQALRQANDAVSSEPWAASPYVQRALVEETSDELDAAALDLQRGIRRESQNYQSYLLLARVEAERGNVQSALTAFEKAKALSPESQFVRPQ